MIGTLENPTLDLNPALPETLDVITATRAGVATFTDANGLIATAPANTVRVDHVDGVPMILVEPSATNLVTYSEDFSNAAWTKFGGGTGIAPVVTPDFGTSPDGTVSASRVQFNKGTGTTVGDQSTIFDAEATSSGATTSKSIYLKSNTNEAYEMVIYEVTNASGTNVKKITVTPDWQRFDVYGAVSSTTTGIAIGLREINVSGLSNTADVLVWGAQLETGSVATSYIPTSGSTVTRAADDLVISGSDFSDFYNASEGTVYTEAVGRGYFDFNSVFAISNNTFNESIYQRTPSNNQVLVVIDGGNVQASLGSSTTPTGTLVRRAASFKLNNFKGSHDGVDTNSDTSGTIPTVDRLHIGASASAANKLNGHIKRLIVWPLHSDSL
tara:strand:+ start:4006 stop:5157 length:1152 start_codon:yes stop_codon:yes gene_type:complete